MACEMQVVIKNTFLQVKEHSSNISRRCHSVPREWKPIPTCTTGYYSDASTDYSPRSHGSLDSSFEESPRSPAKTLDANERIVDTEAQALLARSIAAGGDRGKNSEAQSQKNSRNSIRSSICQRCSCSRDGDAADEPHKPGSSAPSQKHVNLQELTSAIYAALTLRLPSECVNVETVFTEESSKGIVFADVPSGSLAKSQCYDVMQQCRRALTNVVSRLDAVVLLSARVQKEDFGYSLRSSVACVPDFARDKMCWEIVRHGSCSRNKCCRWYHPQAADLMKLKIVIRRQDANGLKK